METNPLGSTTYAYDAAGRLATQTSKELSITTTHQRGYDGDGRLTSFSMVRGPQSVTTSLTWDPTAGVPSLASTTSQSTIQTGSTSRTTSSTKSWVDAGSGVLGVSRVGSAASVRAKDVQGSVTTTLATADVATAAAYDPYGVPDLALSLADLSLTPTFGYRGALTLGDDVFLTARTYDPATGQFLTADTVQGGPGAATTNDDYTYAANEPLDLVDPWGRSPISDAAIGSLGLGGTVSGATPWWLDLPEWGARHRAVQLWFKTAIRPGTDWEVKIPGAGVGSAVDGRVDLVFWLTREVWEVKTATWLSNGRRGEAIRQLQGYVNKFPGGGARKGAMSTFAFPYGNDTMEVTSAGDMGMLWYELRQDRKNRQAQEKEAQEARERAAQQLETQPIPSPSPGPAPTPPSSSAHSDSGSSVGGRILAGVGGGLLVLGGALLIGAKLAEDVATGGVGILDDPLTIGGGAAGVTEGWGLLAEAFALAA